MRLITRNELQSQLERFLPENATLQSAVKPRSARSGFPALRAGYM